MSNLKARQEILSAIRANGPVKHSSLPAFLSKTYTASEINKTVAELVYLGRVTINKEQLTAK